MSSVAPIDASNKHERMSDHSNHMASAISHLRTIFPSMRKSSSDTMTPDGHPSKMVKCPNKTAVSKTKSSESCGCSHSNSSSSSSKPRTSSSSYNKNSIGSSSNEAIRSRFFYRLGIHTPGNTSEKDQQQHQQRLLENTHPTFVPLKYKSEEEYLYRSPRGVSTTFTRTSLGQLQSSVPLQSATTTIPQRKNKIAFSSTVAVVPIPKHQDYSNRIKTRLWSNRHEIQKNAQRNYIEFAAEGWDWRAVTEENNMFLCTASGELIHPVHCRPFYHLYSKTQKTQYPQSSFKKEVPHSTAFQTKFTTTTPQKNYY